MYEVFVLSSISLTKAMFTFDLFYKLSESVLHDNSYGVKRVFRKVMSAF